jgi:hypothetical protein
MGWQKFLMKRGLGSPGQIAKRMARSYRIGKGLTDAIALELRERAAQLVEQLAHRGREVQTLTEGNEGYIPCALFQTHLALLTSSLQP